MMAMQVSYTGCTTACTCPCCAPLSRMTLAGSRQHLQPLTGHPHEQTCTGHGDWAMLSTIQSVGDDQEGAEDGSAAPAQDGEEGHRPRRRSLSLKRQLSNVRAR